MTIVAISREMGSEGYAIGAAVAKALGFEYIDRQIILQAAHAHGVPEATLAAVADRRPSLWERFDVERRRYLTFLEAAYYRFAVKGNIVTASRGGPFFVQDVSHALKVRITAPLEIRVRRIMRRDGLDEKSATAKVRAYDRETAGRSGWIGRFPHITTWSSTPPMTTSPLRRTSSSRRAGTPAFSRRRPRGSTCRTCMWRPRSGRRWPRIPPPRISRWR